jgi:endonuclease III
MRPSESTHQSHYPQSEEIAEALSRCFGRHSLGNKKNPFNELLFIILSAKTPPDRYQAVYRLLRRHYPNANNLSTASYQEIASIIEQAGLQHRKSRAIVDIARRLDRDFGRVTLAPLAKMTAEQAEAFLVSLPGVSLKTARCVLMYSLDQQVFPVDSHCLRICRRLGWLPENAKLTNHRASEIQERIPLHIRKDLHVGMILLGRELCTPINPSCDRCPILSYCPTGKQVVSDNSVCDQ